MLTSITPLGEWGRDQRYVVTVTAFLIGSGLGGAAIGAAAGLAGSAVVPGLGLGATPRLALLATAIAAGLFIDVTHRTDRLPGPARQVNERWLDRYRGWAYGLGFGVQLGLGVVTIVTTAMVYVMLVASFLAASLAAGGAIGAVFGLVRGATVLPAGRVRDPEGLHAVSARLLTLTSPAVRLTATLETAILILAVVYMTT
jgi:hypothetical protein